MTKQQHQADSELHEDQLRTVLVNVLTGAFGISIAGNGDIKPQDIYEGLVGAAASEVLAEIEATYRLLESSLISTTTQDSTRRLLFVVISLLMQNVWR